MAYQDTAAVMEMTDLPCNEWKVLLALAHHRNQYTGLCNPSYATIARYAHLHRSHVGEYLANLKKRGLVDWVPGQVRHVSNLFTLYLEKPTEEAALDERLDPSYPPMEARTCNPQAHGQVRGQVPYPRSGETSNHGTVPHSTATAVERDASRDTFGETQGRPLDPLPGRPTKSSGTTPPCLPPPTAAPFPCRPVAPTLTHDDSLALARLYRELGPKRLHQVGKLPDCYLDDPHPAFAEYSGPLPSSVIANAMWWAYNLSDYWKDMLQPTAEDFLRALPAIHRQYEKFYRRGKKKPHEQWPTVQDVIDKVIPPPPQYFSFDPVDEVEMSGSIAFGLED